MVILSFRMALTYSMTLILPLSFPYLDKTSKAINVPVRPIPALFYRENYTC